MTGSVKEHGLNLTRGFGFIMADDTRADIFFHFRALNGLEFDEHLKGMRVEFDVDHSGDKGPKAINIRAAE